MLACSCSVKQNWARSLTISAHAHHSCTMVAYIKATACKWPSTFKSLERFTLKKIFLPIGKISQVHGKKKVLVVGATCCCRGRPVPLMQCKRAVLSRSLVKHIRNRVQQLSRTWYTNHSLRYEIIMKCFTRESVLEVNAKSELHSKRGCCAEWYQKCMFCAGTRE